MTISPKEYLIREITTADNKAVSKLIKDVMTSFSCVGEGFSIEDEELNDMCAAYSDAQSIYYVLTDGTKVLGGGGIAHLNGGDNDTCELRKMYYYPEVRGQGLGRRMLIKLIEDARIMGYKKCYLETMQHMKAAAKLYAQNGFSQLSDSKGLTGHCGCDAYYEKLM